MDRRIRKFITHKDKSFHSTRKNLTQKMYELQQANKVHKNTIYRLLGHKVDSLSNLSYHSTCYVSDYF